MYLMHYTWCEFYQDPLRGSNEIVTEFIDHWQISLTFKLGLGPQEIHLWYEFKDPTACADGRTDRIFKSLRRGTQM